MATREDLRRIALYPAILMRLPAIDVGRLETIVRTGGGCEPRSRCWRRRTRRRPDGRPHADRHRVGMVLRRWSAACVVAVTFIVIISRSSRRRARPTHSSGSRRSTVDGGRRSSSWPGCTLPVPSETERCDADDTRVDAVLNFFELVRDLNRQGYLDDEEIARSFGAFIVVWWRLLEPVIRAQASLEGRSRNVDRAAGARGNCSRIRQPARRRPRVRPDDADQASSLRA